MALRFQFNERKGTEALAYMAGKHPGLTAFYASKVLFFAEKAHLNRYGRPIVADTFVAMTNGPVPSTLYDFVRGQLGQSGDPEAFNQAIDRSAYPTIVAKREANTTALSASDRACLDDAIAFCCSKSFSYLSSLTHQERAWADAPNNGAMDYEAFFEDDNPHRAELLREASDFAAYGVL